MYGQYSFLRRNNETNYADSYLPSNATPIRRSPAQPRYSTRASPNLQRLRQRVSEWWNPPPRQPQLSEQSEYSLRQQRQEPDYKIYIYTLDDLMDCSICFEPIIKNETTICELKCKHIFCKGCIDQWLKNKSTCPLCRARIKN